MCRACVACLVCSVTCQETSQVPVYSLVNLLQALLLAGLRGSLVHNKQLRLRQLFRGCAETFEQHHEVG